MADIDYPFDLRTLSISRQKTQTLKYDASIPLNGPAYLRKLSTDAPVFYSATFTFTTDNECLLFRAWVERNKINFGTPFNARISTEGNDQQTQEVQVMPDSDILSNSRVGPFGRQYSCTLRCRKEVTGIEDYYEFISDGGLLAIEGREPLDRALNWWLPEGD